MTEKTHRFALLRHRLLSGHLRDRGGLAFLLRQLVGRFDKRNRRLSRDDSLGGGYRRRYGIGSGGCSRPRVGVGAAGNEVELVYRFEV